MQSPDFVRLTAPLAIAICLAACSAAPSYPPPDGPLAPGQWGGDSAAMMVSDTAMHLHIGCTFGDVYRPVAVVNGQFDVTGSYMLRAYPVAYGPTVPARFTGRLSGETVTVTVTVNDTVAHQTVVRGPATVTLGVTPRLMPCPICRRPVSSRRGRWLDHLRGMIRRRSTAAPSTRDRA